MAITIVSVPSAKLNVVFKEGRLPRVDPADPASRSCWADSGSCQDQREGRHKLAAHPGGAVLQGRLSSRGVARAGRCWLSVARTQAGNRGGGARGRGVRSYITVEDLANEWSIDKSCAHKAGRSKSWTVTRR